MMAAALIPLMFILGLLVLFAVGAWPLGAFAGAVVVALLAGIAVALVRVTSPLAR
jgi:hypothetical protein